MTVVDLHPEDLLERDAQGLLDESERARFEAHLAHCTACRMERQLRVDFAGELAGEIPLEKVIGLGVEPPGSPPTASTSRPSMIVLRGPRKRSHRAVWLLAAAALLIGGAAGAEGAMKLRETRSPELRGALAAAAAVTSVAATHAKAHRSAAPVADLPEPAPPVAISEPVAATVVAPPVAAWHAQRAVDAPAVVGAAELFDSASEARRRSDYGRFLDLDAELDRRYPTSREAQVSRAIVGRLLLDRSDPAGALAKFDSYLAAGGGDLGQDAMVGRATALDRLGKTEEAARAWSALTAAFPDSPYAARARARLENSNGR